jgi:hypothetical protein
MSLSIKETIVAGVTVGVVIKVLEWGAQFLPTDLAWLAGIASYLWQIVTFSIPFPLLFLVVASIVIIILVAQRQELIKELKLRDAIIDDRPPPTALPPVRDPSRLSDAEQAVMCVLAAVQYEVDIDLLSSTEN